MNRSSHPATLIWAACAPLAWAAHNAAGRARGRFSSKADGTPQPTIRRLICSSPRPRRPITGGWVVMLHGRLRGDIGQMTRGGLQKFVFRDYAASSLGQRGTLRSGTSDFGNYWGGRRRLISDLMPDSFWASRADPRAAWVRTFPPCRFLSATIVNEEGPFGAS